MIFADRREAGRLLAARLIHLKDSGPLVLGLPRGGVEVGFEIARALQAPLDIVLVRKLGAPGYEELAIGAVAEGDPPEVLIDEPMSSALGVPKRTLERMEGAALREIERRRRLYAGDRAPPGMAGRTVVIADDGIATGATTLVGLRAVRRRRPARMVLAVPVAPPQALERLRPEVDEIVCLQAPQDFSSVGEFYADFRQLTDDEVIALLQEAHSAG